MVLYDFKISMMRIFTLFAHMVFTTVLYWTKFDSIQVTLPSYTSDTEYKSADESFTGLISVSLIFLFIEMIYLGLEVELTLWTVLHLFLDFVACLFIAWIFLDGLAWQTYIYVFVFCSLLPTMYDLSTTAQSLLMGLRMKIRGPPTQIRCWPF